jgi:hypothetical protein
MQRIPFILPLSKSYGATPTIEALIESDSHSRSQQRAHDGSFVFGTVNLDVRYGSRDGSACARPRIRRRA